MKKFNRILKYLPILIIILSLILTQYLLPINVNNKVINIYLVEVFIIILTLLCLIDLIVHKKEIKINKKSIYIVIFFVAWFIILSIYKYLHYGDLTGGFVIFRTLFFPVVFYFIFVQYQIKIKDILLSLLFFILLINIYQIYSLLFVTNSFRVTDTLKNINIYLCFSISVVPILITYLYKLNEFYTNSIFKKFICFTIVINIILFTLFIFLSGSRLAILIYPVILIISYFSTYKFNKKSFCNFILVLLISFLSLVSIINLNVFDSKITFSRSLQPIISFFNISIEESLNEDMDGIVTPEDDNEDNTNDKNKDDNKANASNTSVIDSNNMRMKLWGKSIYYIKKDFIFGKPSVDIDIEMSFVNSDETVTVIQSPHNFILEMWIALGLPGMLIYFALIISLMINILKKDLKLNLKINFILTTLSIFVFSFFQPLVTCYFVISLLLWFNFYIYLKGE